MIFGVVLVVHSLLRWAVIAAGLASVGQAAVGLATGGTFDKRHRLANLAFLIAMDTQLLLGLLLYGVLSPTTTQVVFSDFGAAMKDPGLRFWAVEHLTGMVVAVVVLHVAQVLSKRAKADGRKHLFGLVGFGLAMLITLASIPWPFMAAGRPLFRLGW